MRSLPSGAFDGLDSLTRLYLNDTSLESLPGGAFADLASLITLDLSDNRLLQTSDWPVRPFDGLGSLQILRLANTGTEGSGIAFVNTDHFEDFFAGLGSLRVLDVRPSTPLLGVPRSFLPLTSLETYNGESYTRPADPPRNLGAFMGDINTSIMVDERVITGFETLTFSGNRRRQSPIVEKTGRSTRFCKTVRLTWAAPAGVSGITGYKILRTHHGHPVVRQGKPTTQGQGRKYTASHRLQPLRLRDQHRRRRRHGLHPHTPPPGASGHKFTYYVAAITNNGDGFPAKVKVEADILIPWNSRGSATTGPDVLPCPMLN